MRRWLIAAVFMTLPAAAQEPSAVAQYLAAKQAFLFGETNVSDFLVDYRKHLFEGIEGVWYPASVLDPASDDDGTIAKACERVASRVAVRDAYTLTFTVDEGKDTEVTTVYSSRSGSSFVQYTDPNQLLHRLGLDRAGAMEEAALGALGNSSGLATIVRPSPDILVIQSNYAVPMIWARCPVG
jgi:hypothetical protein